MTETWGHERWWYYPAPDVSGLEVGIQNQPLLFHNDQRGMIDQIAILSYTNVLIISIITYSIWSTNEHANIRFKGR